MPLSLQEIQDKQFHVRFRGFDIEEVDGFLEYISENYALLLEDNKNMKEQIGGLTQELDRVKNQESSFRNAIISAQKIADEMRKKGKDEADNLLIQAHDEIKALKDEAHKEVTDLESRVEQLKGMQVKFEQDINSVIATYQNNLDQIPKVIELEDSSVEKSENDLPDEVRELKDKTPDFSDLYEKIDLGDDLAAISSKVEEDQGGEMDDHAEDILASGNVSKIPDLDSDAIFTLHDPLDDEDIGIDVPINSAKEEK